VRRQAAAWKHHPCSPYFRFDNIVKIQQHAYIFAFSYERGKVVPSGFQLFVYALRVKKVCLLQLKFVFWRSPWSIVNCKPFEPFQRPEIALTRILPRVFIIGAVYLRIRKIIAASLLSRCPHWHGYVVQGLQEVREYLGTCRRFTS
jgi:hypothetical protein